MNPSRRRLPADPEELQRLLLHHGGHDGPTPFERERAMERILAVSTAATAATLGVLSASLAQKGAAASSAKVTALVAAKWALAGAVTAAATLSVSTLVQRDVAPPPSIQIGAPDIRPSQRAAKVEEHVKPMTSGGEASLPPPTPLSVPLLLSLGAPPTGRARAEEPNDARISASQLAPLNAPLETPAAEIPRDRKAPPSLKRELEFLDNARRDLLQQAPSAALAALADYDHAFPAGTLRTEAWALRVEALATAGRKQEAASLARGFLATHAESPHAARIRSLLPQIEGTTYRP